MRTVVRPKKPTILARNATIWCRELLVEIKRCALVGGKVADTFYNKYRQQEIRSSLQSMYQNRCCYCEAPIKVVTYDHIEHRKPKDKTLFPEETFKWTNLHLACPRCNQSKGNQWKSTAPILDAAIDEIEDHLEYSESTVGLLRWPKTPRGDTTICHADLDREGLPITRLKVYAAALKAIRDINREFKKASATPAVCAAVRELYAKTTDDYGSVIAYAIKEWLADDLRS